MLELVFFVAATALALCIIIYNNGFSIRAYLSNLRKPKVFKEPKSYSFKKGMAKLRSIPDITPQNWDFVEEVNEHIRNCRN